MAGRKLTFLFTICAAVALCAASARGTTIVPMSDRELIVSVRAIVEATIVDSEPMWDESTGVVSTYVTIDVERTYKGDVPPGLVVIRQLGGVTSEHATVIYGAPDLRPGQRTLLFLNASADGAMHVAHLSLGHFGLEADPATGLSEVVRPSLGTSVSPVTGEPVTSRADRSAFVADLLGTLAAAGPLAEPAGVPLRIVPAEYKKLPSRGGAAPAFTFLGSGFRWFEPDTGEKVRVKVNSSGAPTTSGGVDEAKAAFRAWSSVSGSRLRVEFDGKTNARGIKTDGATAVSFGDPLSQIDDLVNCQGVVAIAGLAGNPGERVTIRNKTFSRITEADLVVNNGIECLLSQSAITFQEIMTHEFGHDLGLGHSSENGSEPDAALRDATMYWLAHGDGRGASIRQDDSAAIRYLYGTPAGPLALVTDALPDGAPSEGYGFTLEAKGGSSPYTWTLGGGTLPAGIQLASNGRLSGTPSRVGATTFTVRVTDSEGNVEQKNYSIDVSTTPAPFVTAAQYLDGKQKLQVTGVRLDETASVTVNGRSVVPGHTVKYKASKGRLFISGEASALGIEGRGSNTVTVTVNGQTSNTIEF